MTEDNWEHRSDNMKCRTCMWFVGKKKSPGTYKIVGPTGIEEPKTITLDDSMTPPILGRCRRHAPTMNGFPVVYPDDWCGDHKIDETKV